MTLVRSRQSMQLLRNTPFCCATVFPSEFTMKYLHTHTLVISERLDSSKEQLLISLPVFLLLVSNSIHQDLETVPPHVAALFVEVEGDVSVDSGSHCRL